MMHVILSRYLRACLVSSHIFFFFFVPFFFLSLSLLSSVSHSLLFMSTLLLCALHKLQALVYDILPSTTAVFSYAIGSKKLSTNEPFLCWCSNSGKFVTNNSDYIRRLFYNCMTMLLTPAQIKPKSFESRRNIFFFFFLPGGCVSCLRDSLGARLLLQFYQYPNLSEGG